MSKSKLRWEYEARFGVVDDTLKLYNADGEEIYYETSRGYWAKYEYDDDGEEVYYESSNGVVLDKRSCNGKVFIDEQTGKKFKMMEVK